MRRDLRQADRLDSAKSSAPLDSLWLRSETIAAGLDSLFPLTRPAAHTPRLTDLCCGVAHIFVRDVCLS